MYVHFEPTVLALPIVLSVKLFGKQLYWPLFISSGKSCFRVLFTQLTGGMLQICFSFICSPKFSHFTIFGFLIKHLPASASPVAGQGSAAYI